MDIQSYAERRHEEEIGNAGFPSHSDKVPPLEEDENDDQAILNPSPLTDENIRSALFQMSQAITT